MRVSSSNEPGAWVEHLTICGQIRFSLYVAVAQHFCIVTSLRIFEFWSKLCRHHLVNHSMHWVQTTHATRVQMKADTKFIFNSESLDLDTKLPQLLCARPKQQSSVLDKSTTSQNTNRGHQRWLQLLGPKRQPRGEVWCRPCSALTLTLQLQQSAIPAQVHRVTCQTAPGTTNGEENTNRSWATQAQHFFRKQLLRIFMCF